jgi:RNA polymerase sigma-70 factor, ECF subfamily
VPMDRNASVRTSPERMADERLQSLAASAAQGDSAAFAELYGLSARRVFGLCRHMLGSPEAAEDATSEVFLKVHRAFQGVAGSYNPEQRFLPWLLSVAGHFCVDQLRRRGLETRIFAAPRSDADESGDFSTTYAETWTESWTSSKPVNAHDRMLAEAGRDEVRQALAALPEQYRIPLVMRYEGELSYDQIAESLGLKRNHVATLIFRAKREMRGLLAGAPKRDLPQRDLPQGKDFRS